MDARSDVFSLGAVLYEMLTGQVPFPGDHEAAVLYGIMHADPKPLVEFHKNAPQDLQGIVDRAIKKDPKERYQNVLDLRDDLESVREAGGPATARRRRPRRMPDAARKARTRRRVAIGAAVGIVLVTIGLALGPRMWKSVEVKPAHALAVMDFRDLATPDDPTVSAGMTELVNIGLTQQCPVRVISSEYLHDLSRRLFGVTKGPIEESQKIEVARKAEATLLLVATIGKSGESQFATWRLVEAKSGRNVRGGRVEGASLGQLADAIIRDALPLIASASGTKVTAAPTAVGSITSDSERAYQHYTAGLLADEEGRGDDAIAELEKAVARDSTFALAFLELARVVRTNKILVPGYYDLVQTYLDKAWKLESRLGTKDKLRLEAHRQVSEGDMNGAIVTLQDIHGRWPDDRQTLIDLIEVLFGWWRMNDVAQVDEEGQRLYPDDTVFGGAGYQAALVCLGRTDQAVRAGQTYVKRHPRELIGWHQLGITYLAAGLPDSAETAFRKAVELDPSWVPQNFCRSDYHRGDLKGATTCFEKILEQQPLDPGGRWNLIMLSHGQLNLAALYIEAGRYQKMREVCGEYLDVSQIDMPGFRLLVETGRAQAVVDLYRRWVMYWIDRGWIKYWTEQDAKAVPSDSLLYTAADSSIGGYPRPLGQALALLGDAKGAREAAEYLLDKHSGVGAMARYDALEIQARAALADHDPKTALRLLATMKKDGIVWGGYIDIDYRTILAAAYRMDGRLQEAADVHKEMLRIYGGHALSHYELGQIYEEIQRPADAKKEYEKFLEMWSEADEDLPQLLDARARFARLNAGS